MNTKTDEGLYEKARKLFISKASIDEFAGWATPRQVDAVHRLLDTRTADHDDRQREDRERERRPEQAARTEGRHRQAIGEEPAIDVRAEPVHEEAEPEHPVDDRRHTREIRDRAAHDRRR